MNVLPCRLMEILTALVFLIGVSGCGAQRMSPVDPRTTGALTPQIEDADGGLVGLASGFTPASYETVVVQPFKVEQREIKDDEDARRAKDMVAYVQAQLVRKLRIAGIFPTIVDGATATPPTGPRVLLVQGEITRLTEGSQALRYFVGFGAGAAKTQIETRVVDVSTGQVQLVTADRRAAGMGIFGGDGRQFVTESLDQITDGFVKLLRHLAAGGRPGPR